VSNARRPRRTLQHELDLIHGFHNPACCQAAGIVTRLVSTVETSWDGEEIPGWMRVAAASGLIPAQSSTDKQETPGVGTPRASTDRTSSPKDTGGCSAKFA
jgi:hypothetical protein